METIQVTVYDKAGDKPGQLGHSWDNSLDEIMSLVDMSTHGLVPGVWNSDLFYVLDQTVTPRPIIAAPTQFEIHANDFDVVHLTGIPAGTKFSVFNMDVPNVSPDRDVHLELTIDDGILDWSTAYSGRYSLFLDPPWPYQPWKAEAIASDAS